MNGTWAECPAYTKGVVNKTAKFKFNTICGNDCPASQFITINGTCVDHCDPYSDGNQKRECVYMSGLTGQ